MDFASPINITLADTGYSAYSQNPVAVGLTSLVTALVGLLAYLSYTPSVDKKAPALLTTGTTPFIGSFEYLQRQWTFWRKARAQSRTGNFSFWLGKHHVVGISGPNARKVFFETPELEFTSGQALRAFGLHFVPPVPGIFKPGFHKGRSYFIRRLYELHKTEHLVRYLPSLTRDARLGFEALDENSTAVADTSGVCCRIVFAQDCRLMCTDEIADDPKLFDRVLGYYEFLQSAHSLYNVPFPWLPSVSYVRRRYVRATLIRIMTGLLNKRIKEGTAGKDDAMSMLLNHGDREDWIIEFLISVLFISPGNSRVLGGHMLNIMAMHPRWQEAIYDEIKAATAAHSRNSNTAATLIDHLDSLPLEAWESSFPTLELCFREAIRMWTAFGMVRLNISDKAIPISGSDEVIPPGSWVVYNSTEAHYSPELYPEPTKFDPERFLEGREEFKKEPYGFLGWGAGRHPCPGVRWAKLQMIIIVAYALARFRWISCDEHGRPIKPALHRKELDDPRATAFGKFYCKYVPRE
ncbi:cytochrome P450 [Achaetomium macrosporum]|uniref:Cytochrome P450 n=1 Tax=Achaetomium macrosporum TaxID=79813 RepID=A0AAN7H896_9PEZI|nr:cytochrome P450 [Achaetomium macrosporum]